jgi:hypothetical protein
MNSKIYEIYSPYSKGGTTGFFEIKKDTMFLYPKYEFNENLWYKTISDSVSVANTEKYLIQKDKLIEIPDSTYIELYFEITGQQPTKEYLPKPNVFTQIK